MYRNKSNKPKNFIYSAFYNLQSSFTYILLILRIADSITSMPILQIKKSEMTYAR